MDRKFTVSFTAEELDRFTSGMSDLLCWVRGFKAALPDDKADCAPFGQDEARDLNIKLQKAWREARQLIVKEPA